MNTTIEVTSQAVPQSERPKYRICTWGDPATGEPAFGLQAKLKNGTRWMHCCHGNLVLLYRSRKTARRILRWLKDPKGTEPEWNDDSALRS